MKQIRATGLKTDLGKHIETSTRISVIQDSKEENRRNGRNKITKK